MTSILSPIPHRRAAGRAGEREDRCAQPASGTRNTAAASSKFQHVERGAFRAICKTGDCVHVRAAGVTSLKTETQVSRPQVRLLAHLFQPAAITSLGSVIASVLPVAGLAGSLLPFWRGFRLFNSVGPLKAARRLFLPLRFNSSQEPKRRAAQGLKTFSSALSHVRNLAWGSKHEVHRKSASGAQSSE